MDPDGAGRVCLANLKGGDEEKDMSRSGHLSDDYDCWIMYRNSGLNLSASSSIEACFFESCYNDNGLTLVLQ